MKRTKYSQECQNKQQDNAKEKNRPTKGSPQDLDGLVSAIKNSRLDGRTAHARRLVRTRKMLSDAPIPTALGLVRDALAVNGIIAAFLIREISKSDFEAIDAQGELTPILARHWPEVQKAILNSATALLRLEQANAPEKPKTASRTKSRPIAPGDKDEVDVSALVLELSNAKTKECSDL